MDQDVPEMKKQETLPNLGGFFIDTVIAFVLSGTYIHAEILTAFPEH